MIFTFIFGIIICSNIFASSDIKINVNGKEIKSDVKCYIKNDRVMVPVRFITEELGGEVKYNKNEEYNYQSVYVRGTYEPLGISLHIGSPIAKISEGAYRADVAPEIKNGRTMVPLRFIADYLNLDVKWYENTRTVYLKNSDKDWLKNFHEKYFDEKAAKKWAKG